MRHGYQEIARDSRHIESPVRHKIAPSTRKTLANPEKGEKERAPLIACGSKDTGTHMKTHTAMRKAHTNATWTTTTQK